MGIRSDVGIVVTKKLDSLIRENADEAVSNLLNWADKRFEKEGQILYVFENEKWDNFDNTEYTELENILAKHEEEYFLQHICQETDYIDNKGLLHDNHFALAYRCTLSYTP